MNSISIEECQKRLRNMCMIHRDTVYFYYDVATKTSYVEPNEVLPTKLQGERINLLKALYEGDYIAEEDVARYETFYQRILEGIKQPIDMEEMSVNILTNTAQSPDTYETVRVVAFFKRDDEGKIIEITGKYRPQTATEKINHQIVSQFSADVNPSIFFERVDALIKKYPEDRFAYIQFDVNKFKLINDNYGSDMGDEIISHIYDNLEILCSDDQIHTRASSDHFIIVMRYESDEQVIEFINSIDEKLNHYNGISFKFTYGVCVSDDRKLSIRSYMDEADLARAAIKGNVLEKINFYDSGIIDKMRNTNDIEMYEDVALNNHEFLMYLQPKFEFAENNSAVIVGAEALVRWKHPEKGMIMPNDFIPIFEQNGFILKVDQYIWECAVQTISRWIDEGKTPVPISVNISRSYLKKIDVVAYISSLVEKYDIPKCLLPLEITETMEDNDTTKYVENFKNAGFTMLMDDFGSGYSSLNMLKNTQFDVLKIDRAFLSEFLESNRGKSIVAHVISMSEELGLDTIAEGVETEEQVEFLYQNGCKVAQGFYFSRPLPIEEFERLAWPDFNKDNVEEYEEAKKRVLVNPDEEDK